MPFPVTLQRAADERQRLLEGEVLGIEGDDRGLATQVPQEPLLGDPFRNPRHDPFLEPTETRGLFRWWRTAAATLLRLVEHHRKTVTDASDYPFRAVDRLRFLDRSFAVELVPVAPDRDNEHIHLHRRYQS